VSSQLRIASGESLDDLGLSQDRTVLHRAALQCPITTEDPADSPHGVHLRAPGGPSAQESPAGVKAAN